MIILGFFFLVINFVLYNANLEIKDNLCLPIEPI